MRPFYFVFFSILILAAPFALAQKVEVKDDPVNDRIDIFIEGKPFTSFLHSPRLEKPVLFPVHAPNGAVVTRGYPIAPRPGERVDHPHHEGIWFNHGGVNGLDFWNNSSAIPDSLKKNYGHIAVVKILKAQGGNKGIVKEESDWMDNSGTLILRETTEYIFSSTGGVWTIDRVTRLKALNGDVTIADSKEGLFAIRVDRAFEMPSNEPLVFTDSRGNPTEVKVVDNTGVTGMYTGSNGKKGDAVWGTRNNWVVLSGTKDGTPVSMALFDNPLNPGFPARFHARGYGLFSVNNFGSRSYDPSAEKSDYLLKSGKSVSLVHRFCVKSGSELTAAEAEKIFEEFRNEYK
jgi:hypothetical protein